MKSFDRVISLPLQPGRAFDRLEIACAVRFFASAPEDKNPFVSHDNIPGHETVIVYDFLRGTAGHVFLRRLNTTIRRLKTTLRRLLLNPALRCLNLFTPLFAG